MLLKKLKNFQIFSLSLVLLQLKVEEVKENFNKEFEAKLRDFQKKHEERIQRTNDIFTRGEKSAEEIKQKICNAQVEVIETKSEVIDSVPENQEKVSNINFVFQFLK